MKKIIFLLIISISFSQCVYDDYEPIDTDASDNTDGDTNNDENTDGTTSDKTTYLGHVKPLLNQLCISCHGPVDPEDDLDISTYTKAKAEINDIIEAMDKSSSDEDIMPPSGRVDDAIAIVKKWKTDGLLEGEETDSTSEGNADGNITYTTDIKAILEQECTACHGSTNPSGGLGLTTYTDAKNSIASIINRIDLQTGQAGIMPTAGRMSEDKIQKFKDWQTQGLLEQ